jgi:ribosome biogenesis protein ENP2
LGADGSSGGGGAIAGAAAATDGASIYEDYKFLVRDEIESLGMENLVGTRLLRGYMLASFDDVGLCNRVRAVANPFEYEEYRKRKVRERMERKRASRIAPRDGVGVSNNSKKAAAEKGGKRSRACKLAATVLTDDRFGSLFSNSDFRIDEDDINSKLRNPSGVADGFRCGTTTCTAIAARRRRLWWWQRGSGSGWWC